MPSFQVNLVRLANFPLTFPPPHILFNTIPPFCTETGEGTALKWRESTLNYIPWVIIGAVFCGRMLFLSATDAKITWRMAIANGTCVSFCTFWSLGYAPGTIAVNVTWMERWFDAGQTHRSMYPYIFNRLRAIARYWSEIATFSYPLHLAPPLGCSHWISGEMFGPQKTRIMGLPGSEDSLTIGWAVSTQYHAASVGRTDGRTDVQPIL